MAVSNQGTIREVVSGGEFEVVSIDDDGQGRVVTLRQLGVYNPDTGALEINRADGDIIRVTTNTPDGTVTHSVVKASPAAGPL